MLTFRMTLKIANWFRNISCSTCHNVQLRQEFDCERRESVLQQQQQQQQQLPILVQSNSKFSASILKFSGCRLEKNIGAFSSTVVPLADGLNTFHGAAVCKATTRALEKLSRDPYNCGIIHEYGALKVRKGERETHVFCTE